MNMETQFRLKTGNDRPWAHLREEPVSPGRDLIFRRLFPGVFVYLIAYYAFAHDPSVADFYTKNFLGPRHHHHHEEPQSNSPVNKSSPSHGRFDPATIVWFRDSQGACV